MGWLAMVISFQTILIAFYFDCPQTHNSISMVNSGGNFLPRKRSFHQTPSLAHASKTQPSRTWLLVILIFIIDIFTYINLLILLFIEEPFDPAPADGNGKASASQAGDQQLD
jgi:hypothetical protein